MGASCISVRPVAGKGRGVFAVAPIRAGDLIDIAPAIPLDAQDTDALPGTRLDDYYFANPVDAEGGLMVLGPATLCNHSSDPNVETNALDSAPSGWTVEMRALRDIVPGEELTRRYACDPWFDVKA